MDESTAQPKPVPDRIEAIPGSYAVHVDENRIDVWEFRVNVSEPDGAWHFTETLDRDDDPKLSLDRATLLPPAEEGYWVYATSYDCELGCR